MRAYTFLGDALKPYQAAVVGALRVRGHDLAPLETARGWIDLWLGRRSQ